MDFSKKQRKKFTFKSSITARFNPQPKHLKPV